MANEFYQSGLYGSDIDRQIKYVRDELPNDLKDLNEATEQLKEQKADKTEIPSTDTFASKEFVKTEVAKLVESAPETLDTLNELADALGNDPNFATTVATEIGKKVDKVDGKGLSTNDFTNEDKEKVDSAISGTEVEEMLSAPRPSVNFTNGIRFEVRNGELHAVIENEHTTNNNILVDADGDIWACNSYFSDESNYAFEAMYANSAYVDEYDRPLKGVGIDEFGDEEDAEICLEDGYAYYRGIVSNSLDVYLSDVPYAGFFCALYFTTPSVIPDNYSQFPEDIHFKGDSVDETFVPEPNTRYTIGFDFDGYMLNGYVSGVPAPSVSEVTENE